MNRLYYIVTYLLFFINLAILLIVVAVYSKCPRNFEATPFNTCWYVQSTYTVDNAIALKRCSGLRAKLVTLETVRKMTYLDRFLTLKG